MTTKDTKKFRGRTDVKTVNRQIRQETPREDNQNLKSMTTKDTKKFRGRTDVKTVNRQIRQETPREDHQPVHLIIVFPDFPTSRLPDFPTSRPHCLSKPSKMATTTWLPKTADPSSEKCTFAGL
jgi:hypothetical protein